jgi:hypothetical protein
MSLMMFQNWKTTILFIFGYPRTFVQYTNVSFKYGPCFRGCSPFPIGDMNVDESIKGDMKLEMFTNMGTSIQVPSHHNLG